MFYVTFFSLKQNKEVASWRRHAVRVTRGERNREFARRITITYSLTNALGHGLYSARCRQIRRCLEGKLRQSIAIVWLGLILALPLANRAFAQGSPDWTEPFPPFHIAGNLYYVGSKGLATYLVTTPQGNILINSDLESNVPMIEASIEKLGFKFKDTKVLLISHAHWDHDAGSATI